jgi:hypothetical protein
MSVSPKPSKFQGLFKQAAESPTQATKPEGRVEHEAVPEQPSICTPETTESEASHRLPASQSARSVNPGAGQGTNLTAERRPLGRPAGKRTDKDWKQFSVLLRHEDQFQAVNILRSTRDKRDFSTLMQSLLETWLKKQGTKS